MKELTEKLPSRRIFALDIDENLVSIQLAEDDAHSLSISAQQSLSSSASGTIDKPELVPGMFGAKATAFRRSEWKAFFEEIISINEHYKIVTHDPIPLISIIFITNAFYTGNEFINNIFRTFFGEKITEQLAPDISEFYNRSNQLQEIKHLDKSDYLEHLFPHLQDKFALIGRSQITLIDDSLLNIHGVLEYGFSAIHHPSTPAQRLSFFNFTTHGADVFEQMHQILKEVNAFVCSLEEKTISCTS